MRTPMRRRPRPRTQDVPPDTDLGALAERARYIGSPEHKDMPTFAGQPRPRAMRRSAREITMTSIW